VSLLLCKNFSGKVMLFPNSISLNPLNLLKFNLPFSFFKIKYNNLLVDPSSGNTSNTFILLLSGSIAEQNPYS
jgi:hypothetical protein